VLNGPLRAASTLFVLGIAAIYRLSGGSPTHAGHPLQNVPAKFHNWQMIQDVEPEASILDQLKADDVISRNYRNASGDWTVALFAAYFQSPKAGTAPHSPKVCLPTDGWRTGKVETVSFPVSGLPHPPELNRMLISREGQEVLLVYWYQTYSSTVTNEFAMKWYMALDSFRFHRTDTSFVRVAVPVMHGDEVAAQEAARSFVDTAFLAIGGSLPGAGGIRSARTFGEEN